MLRISIADKMKRPSDARPSPFSGVLSSGKTSSRSAVMRFFPGSNMMSYVSLTGAGPVDKN